MSVRGIRAVEVVQNLADHDAEGRKLLAEFLDRFYWVKDHPDYFDRVKKHLAKN